VSWWVGARELVSAQNGVAKGETGFGVGRFQMVVRTGFWAGSCVVAGKWHQRGWRCCDE